SSCREDWSLFKIVELDSLKLNNYGLKVKWQQYWHPHIKTTVLAMRSDYAYDYTYDFDVRNSSREDRNGIKNNRICEQQLQINNTYTNARQQQWRAGYHLQQYSVDSQITGRSRGNITDDEDLSNSFAVHTIYADFSSPTNKKIGIEAGMRWNYLSIANRNNNFAEPRLRLWYQPTQHLQLYGNAGRYYQFISQIIEIEGDEASIQTPIWVLGGTKAFPFLNATQYQLGGVWRHRGWLVDLQLYHKTINGLTSLASNFDELTSFRFHIGTADIRGLDVLIKKRWGAWRSWMSYSYARQQHEFPTFFDQTFPATTEQPHQLHLVQTYRIGKFDCSLGWKLTSGTPYSNRRDFQIINHNRQQDGDFVQLVPSGSTFNEKRLPLLHQMDLSLQYSQQTDNRKLVVGLSILNIYNRRNIYQRSFFINRKSPGQLRLSYLDRANLGFTPNAVIRIEW
ncbi:MAG: TonB-dependent receptor, partial [Bacteroidota bacterium]